MNDFIASFILESENVQEVNSLSEAVALYNDIFNESATVQDIDTKEVFNACKSFIYESQGVERPNTPHKQDNDNIAARNMTAFDDLLHLVNLLGVDKTELESILSDMQP